MLSINCAVMLLKRTIYIHRSTLSRKALMNHTLACEMFRAGVMRWAVRSGGKMFGAKWRKISEEMERNTDA